ncbi:hypothetical protein AB0I60_37450 [Actinosynnema sp. NPDC050436]|uniref:hypothetical protein n=1 Tax=Actinosynnema sp. NPDC050436 TaxID=3155659 RepID=UPI00340162A2
MARVLGTGRASPAGALGDGSASRAAVAPADLFVLCEGDSVSVFDFIRVTGCVGTIDVFTGRVEIVVDALLPEEQPTGD